MNPLRLYYSLLAGAAVVLASGAVYWIRAHRKTPEQREYERRQRLKSMGRITDGTVIDLQIVGGGEASPSHFLIYTYDVRGVSYECSQDITSLRQSLGLDTCQIGLPASIKYDPHNPGNSIVVAEGWTGLRG
jgi:hypothetical protein